MSWVSKNLGGGGNDLIATLANPIGAATGMGFGGLFGGMFPGAPQVPGFNIPQFNQGDQQALQKLMGDQNNLMEGGINRTNQNFDQLQGADSKTLQDIVNKSRENFFTNLNGPQGEAFRQHYNNMGLLDSGAFNQGLANAMGQEQQNTDMALMGQGLHDNRSRYSAIQDLIGGGLGNQMQLGQAGLQRQFGLEDAQTNATIQQMMANAQLKQQNQQGNQQFLGGLLGGGLGLLSGGLFSSGASAGPKPSSGGGWGTGYSPQYGNVGTGYY